MLPKIAASIITDFDAWKRAFEADAPGILARHVHRSVDDPRLVCVVLAAADRESLERFLGHGEIELLVPQEDRATTTAAAAAAALVSFDVESYERWKAAFDAILETRRRASVVGHVVSRSAANPNRVVVYFQAESASQLRAMFESNALTSAMKKAGVRRIEVFQ